MKNTQTKNRWTILLGISLVLSTATALGQGLPFDRSRVPVQAGLSATEYHSKALDLKNQAEATYNPGFFDQIGWQQAIAYAEAAVNAEPTNPTYLRTLGESYTQSQYWIEGYRAFKQLESMQALDSQAIQWAALCATKVGYIRLSNNAPQEAIPYLQDALAWQANPQTEALLNKAYSQTIAVAGQ